MRLLKLLPLLLVLACADADKAGPKYFDFDRFIDDQVNELSQRRRVLEKSAAVNGHQTDSTFIPSLEIWNAEMEIFRQLDMINLPAYQKFYTLEDPVKDNRSNLKIRQYIGKDTPIAWIKFYYQDDFSRLRFIEAELLEKNLLFTNRRLLKMEFEDDNGHLMVHFYSMNGFQKMMLKDTVHFSVSGRIEW